MDPMNDAATVNSYYIDNTHEGKLNLELNGYENEQ